MTTCAAGHFFGLTATRASLRVTGCGFTCTSALCQCTRKHCGVKAVARGRVLRLRLGGLARRAGYLGTRVRISSCVRSLHDCLNVSRGVGLMIVPSSDVPRFAISMGRTVRLTFRGGPSVDTFRHHQLRDRDGITRTGTGQNFGTTLCTRFNLARDGRGLGRSCHSPVSRRLIALKVHVPVLS